MGDLNGEDKVGYSAHGLDKLKPHLQLETGTQRLAYAVLMDAINVYNGRRFAEVGAQQRLVREARRWFESELDYPWSLEWVCQVLKLDASAVREGVFARRGVFHRGVLP